jgi:hypothetical protein
MNSVYAFCRFVILLLAISCGRDEQSQFSSLGAATPFSIWCKQVKLSECLPERASQVSKKDWDNSLKVTQAILSSPSKIFFSRSDLARPAVKRLFEVSGADDLRGIISQVPWQTLSLGQGKVTMANNGTKGAMNFKGLTFLSTGEGSFSWVSPLSIDVKGVLLKTLNGEQLVLSKIDLSSPERLAFVTDKLVITDIPVAFFALKPRAKENTSLDVVISALADVIFESGFDWRAAIDVSLTPQNITSIRQVVTEAGMDPFFKLLDGALSATKQLGIGGKFRKDVLGIDLLQPMTCSMKFTNVPILGNVAADINFAKRFGLSAITRQNKGVLGQVYGITTSLGTFQSVSIEGSKIFLKLGVLTIPLDLQSTDRTGPQVSDIVCKNSV